MGNLLVSASLLSFLAVVMLFGSISPIMADSGDNSYKRYGPISIGESTGTIEIAEGMDKEDLRDQAMPLSEVSEGYGDIHKAKLGDAINDDGKSYLIWMLVISDAGTKTIHILDAGTGEALIEPIIKEGGSCGYKDRSQSTRSADNA